MCYFIERTQKCTKLFFNHYKKGQLIEDADIIIGTTAIINNMVMVTENVKHIGRLNGIVVENWIEK